MWVEGHSLSIFGGPARRAFFQVLKKRWTFQGGFFLSRFTAWERFSPPTGINTKNHELFDHPRNPSDGFVFSPMTFQHIFELASWSKKCFPRVSQSFVSITMEALIFFFPFQHLDCCRCYIPPWKRLHLHLQTPWFGLFHKPGGLECFWGWDGMNVSQN